MKNIYSVLLITVIASIYGCTDLEILPESSATSEVIFEDATSYESFLAKLYAGFAVTGQDGPSGDADISGIDEGASSYIRQYWQLQELPTDEAVNGWADGNLPDLSKMTWTDDNEFVAAMYYRVFYNISLANEFIRESTDEVLNERGFTDSEVEEIRTYRSEARFIRAFSYWHGLDLFANIPFYTEEDEIGGTAPDQATPEEVFAYIVSELEAIESELGDPGTVEYGRADKAAAWALQAKVYLNAETYQGTSYYDEAITACNKIIESGVYSLMDNYQDNFKADNHNSSEIIFAINFDGTNTQTYGGTTYIVNSAVGGSMEPTDYGIAGGWGGNRVTGNLVDLFSANDGRAIFYTDGQTKEITDLSEFTNGYAAPKFVNVTSTGASGSNETYSDTDFPFFRLAEIYLTYAEAVLRGGSGGNLTTALSYANELRARAYGSTTVGALSASDLDLDFILDERGRELYWEGHRRTDLIRFGQYSDAGVWPWKGGTQAGQVLSSYLDLYPIPAAELIANPKLQQNDDY